MSEPCLCATTFNEKCSQHPLVAKDTHIVRLESENAALRDELAGIPNARWPKWVAELQTIITDLRAALERERDAARADAEKAWALVDEVSGEEPANQDEQGGCIWCGGPCGLRKGATYGYATADPADHHPGCAWLKARTAFNEQAKREREERR